MTSSGQAPGPRHAGRVIDPLARDDGATDPELQLSGGGADSGGEGSKIPEEIPKPLDATPAEDAEESVHPVRARLLARAHQAKQTELESFGETGGGLDEIGRVPRSKGRPLDLELDAIAAGASRPPSAPVVRRGRAQLSPSMLAVFGTLLGLASVATLVALAMSLGDERNVPRMAETPAQEAAKPAQPSEAPPKPKRKRKKLPGPWRIVDAKGKAGVRILDGTIGREPFLRAVQDAGLEKKQAYRVLTALKGLKDLNKCDKSDQFRALVERASGRVKAFEYIVSKEEVYQAREGNDGLLGGRKLDLKVKRERIEGALVMSGSFSASAEKHGFDAGLRQVLAEALDGHMGVDELETGDRVRLVAQEVTVLGEFSRYAGVEAVEVIFAGDRKPVRVYYFSDPKARGYYDASGRAPYEGGWRKPISDAPITSKFNPKRMHPVLNKVMPHTGTDFGAGSGTPVGASSYGTVSFIGYAGASGNLVKVDHAGGYETGYAHLSRFGEGLKVGDKVKRMQVVGYVGSTGRSTGPHLHFTVKKDGKFIDPESLNLDGMRVIPKEFRAAFAETKQKYDRALAAIPLPKAPAAAVAEAPSPEPAAAEEMEEDLAPEPALAEVDEPAPAEDPEPRGDEPALPAYSGGSSSAVYLTDEELLKLQGRSSDGEVRK